MVPAPEADNEEGLSEGKCIQGEASKGIGYNGHDGALTNYVQTRA